MANLSRYSQAVSIRLPDYIGCHVKTIFSDNEFPRVTETPYVITLAPHTFFWLALERPAEQVPLQPGQTPVVQAPLSWHDLLGSSAEPQLLQALQGYVQQTRWFGGKGRRIRATRIADHLVVPAAGGSIYILLLEISYTDGTRDNYVVPIGLAVGDQQVRISSGSPEYAFAQLRLPDQEGVLYDAAISEDLHRALLEMIARSRGRRMDGGQVIARRGHKFSALLGSRNLPLASHVLKAEQSNTAIVYQDSFFLKLYRRVEEGVNPELELSIQLTQNTNFANLPAYAGAIEWQREHAGTTDVAVLMELVPNQGDAWSFTLDSIDRPLSDALTLKSKLQVRPEVPPFLRDIPPESAPETVRDFIGPVYMEMVGLLGQRTGELHLALMSLSQSPDLTPEPFSLLYQKSLYQSIRGLVLRVFGDLDANLRSLPAEMAEAVRRVLAERKNILNRVHRIMDRKIAAMKMRTHGDYHLGQVLYTGKDFVIIDFEGEPNRPLTERRLKQPALRDIAGMIRSFHYAAHVGLRRRAMQQGADVEYLQHWADLWHVYVSGLFLHSYLKSVADTHVVPSDEKDFAVLLETFVLEKAVYELGYELNNRPDWLMIPVRGIEQILR